MGDRSVLGSTNEWEVLLGLGTGCTVGRRCAGDGPWETGRDQKTRTDSKEEQEMEYKDQRVLSGAN